MKCREFESQILDLAARSAEPAGELRRHLSECDDCANRLSAELALLAKLDAEFSNAVNIAVPASFLPRVRLQVEKESICPPVSWNSWLVPAIAFSCALAIAVFLANRNAPVHQGRSAATFPIHQEVTAEPNLPVASPSVIAMPSLNAESIVARRGPLVRQSDSRLSDKLPEVIIATGQKRATVQFIRTARDAKWEPLNWNLHSSVQRLSLQALSIEPVKIEPLAHTSELDSNR